jgi:hypothetical protein
LFEAIGAEIMRVMLETPEGKAKSRQMFDEMFAPGGIFYACPRTTSSRMELWSASRLI